MKSHLSLRLPVVVAALGLAASAASLTGCLGLPQAQTDPTRTYVLSLGTAPAMANASTRVVRLRPVELPSYLRTRSLVVRRGDNEIQLRDFARWGEPLELGIARVLREDLLARGGARTVQSGLLPAPAGEEPNFELTVRVLACEGLADGRVAFRAAWELSPVDATAGAAVSRGDFQAAELKWSADNEATLAAAVSRGVDGLAAEIAAALAR
ncbi:PqiC family protein [Opitutus sp. ER46]|uniref:PqiC family protein n=1 Tax=Opitutus sp. ER46 TaxID=2161864 RepID=UPI000D3069A0|nr:PqiC family protein [Opitutus sp. ER46]PTX97886.1 hypothetical protein DB354_06295 [Opitutus sp. ER46]